MTTFFLHLVGTFPIVVLLLGVRAANSPRSTRVRQVPLPVVAVVFAVLALIVLYRFNTAFDGVLAWAFRLFPFLGNAYDVTWLYTVENALVVAAFAILKYALRPLLARTANGEHFLGSALASPFYVHDAGSGLWFVRPHLSTLRTFYRVFYWVSFGLCLVLIALAQTIPGWPGFLAVSFPAIAVLVLGEFFFAIDGVTRAEHRDDIAGERDASERAADYGALRHVLRSTFPEHVLDDDVAVAPAPPTSPSTRLNELARSEQDVDLIGTEYFERLREDGAELDTDLVDTAIGLMRGSSALINNPFYADLTPYLSFPAYFHLLQSRKCLVIAGRDAIADDLVEWIRQGLESITGVPDLWRVEQLGDAAADDIDVAVLRFADIHNLELVRTHDDLLAQVQFVILAEPSRMLSTGQLGLGLVLSRCGRDAPAVFAAFDRNHDGLVDALSHLLKVNITDVIASGQPHGVSSEMVWRTDGPPMHSQILPGITRYLGIGTEIAAVALKYQVAEVHWVGADAFPVSDMTWISGQYHGQINAFAEIDSPQNALAASIIPHSNPWDIPRSENRFLVVEDEARNVYETIRLFTTRGTRNGFVNVISDDYLLRDYMIANREIFSADAKAIPSIVPDFARTERNVVFRLLITLIAFELSESALTKEFELLGRSVAQGRPDRAADEEDPTLGLLRELIQRHTGISDLTITRSTRVEDGEVVGHDVVNTYYRVGPGAGADAVLEALKPAYFFVEDEVEQRNYIGGCLYGHVYQTALPGQFLTFAGKYYEVQSIGTSAYRDGVVLRRAAEHIRGRRAYRQLRAYQISDTSTAQTPGSHIHVGGVELLRRHATIGVRTLGYIERTTGEAVASSRRVEVDGIPDRAYQEKEFLEIRLPGVAPHVRRTIAVMLNELFVTVFPYAHPYIVALTNDPDREFGDLLPAAEHDVDDGAILIVEDSLIDLGLTVAVERNWRRLLEIITDYLLWQTTAPAANPEPVTRENDAPIFAPVDATPATPKVSLWRRIRSAVRRWLGIPRDGEASAEPSPAPVPAPPVAGPPPAAAAGSTPRRVDMTVGQPDGIAVEVAARDVHDATAVTGQPDEGEAADVSEPQTVPEEQGAEHGTE
jgi:hypothetical protein